MIFVRSRQEFPAQILWADEPLGGTLTRARRTGAALATLVAVALIGAGCSSSGSSGKPTAQTTANRGQNQINPVAYDKLKQGGTLNYPLLGTIVNFNLDEVDGATSDTQTIMNSVLPQMFNTDAANNFTYNPNYLTGEPKVTTSPNQVITYELNPKAVWADGTQLSANDFIAQWQALNATNKAFTVVATTGYEDIASVAAGANPQEVIVTFKPGKTYADWKGLFGLLYPASANATPAAFNTGWKAKPLDSAGPYMFQSQDTTAQTYTFVPNPKWWAQKPKLDKIVFKVIPDVAATATALQNHEIDIDNVGPDATTYAKVKTFQGVDVRQAGGPNFRHITINGSRPELQDVNTRQALAMGIDRDAIAAAELTPLGVTPATSLGNHVFMKNQDGYVDNSGVVKYDPVAAASKLDAAGWVDDTAKHVRTKAGKTLEINFVIPSGVPVSASEAQLVQNQLAKIDVKVNINVVDINAFFDKYITPGNFDFTVFAWIGTSYPVSSASSVYEAQLPSGGWQQNYSRVSDPAIDDLFNKAENDLNPQSAIATANQADALVWKDVLSLTTYQRPDIWAVNSKLANFGAPGFGTIDWTMVGFTALS
jgi:peptide/nickel transport system substrate-binding protein